MQRLELATFYVRIVTTHKGGATSQTEMRFTSMESAIETVDRLQADFDADAEPKRAYVLDRDWVPIAAGGERPTNRKRSNKHHSRTIGDFDDHC